MEYLSYVITYNNLFLVLQLIAGIGLGILYYGSLWLTVQILPWIPRPKLFMLGCFIGRMIVVASALCLMSITVDHHWERLMVCMLGFLLIRIYLIQYYSHPFRLPTLRFPKGYIPWR